MKSLKLIAPYILAGMLFLGMSSCSKSDDAIAGTDANTQKVNILSTQFDPNPFTLHLGIKINWVNNDTEAHSVVSDDGISFNSGVINPGGSYTITPNLTGTYQYHCGIHPAVKGTFYIVVR